MSFRKPAWRQLLGSLAILRGSLLLQGTEEGGVRSWGQEQLQAWEGEKLLKPHPWPRGKCLQS